MKTLAALSTLTIALFGWSFGSLAYMTTNTSTHSAIYAEDKCQDGEQWNEESQTCEKADASN